MEFLDCRAGFAGITTGLLGFLTGLIFTLFLGDELLLRVSLTLLSLSTKDGEGTTFLGGLEVTFGLLIVLLLLDEPEELLFLFLFEELRFVELLELVAVEVVDVDFFLFTPEELEDDDFVVVDFLVELLFEAVLLRLRRLGVYFLVLFLTLLRFVAALLEGTCTSVAA